MHLLSGLGIFSHMLHSHILKLKLGRTHQEVCDDEEVLRVLYRWWCFSNGGEC